MFDFNLKFDFLDDKEKAFLEKNKWFKTPDIGKPVLADYKYAKDLAEKLDATNGFNAYGFMSGAFIFGDLIEALFVSKNWYSEVLTISTLSLSQDNIDSLKNLLVGKYIGKLDLITSAYFYSHERNVNGLIPYMYDQYKDFDFQLTILRSHCKIVCFKNEHNQHITIHGSANLRSSGNIEQIQIQDNKEFYDYNMLKLAEQAKDKGTIKK